MLRDGEALQIPRVDEQVLGLRQEREHGAAQGEKAGVVDIECINLLHLCAPHADGDGLRADLGLQGLALDGSELLGVVDALDPGPGREDDRRGDHRARERRHAHFVDARDQRQPGVPERLLEGAQPRQSAALRLRRVDPPPDAGCHLPCAGAAVGFEEHEPAPRKLLSTFDEPAAHLLEGHRAKLVESRHGRTRTYRARGALRKPGPSTTSSRAPSPRCAS